MWDASRPHGSPRRVAGRGGHNSRNGRALLDKWGKTTNELPVIQECWELFCGVNGNPLILAASVSVTTFKETMRALEVSYRDFSYDNLAGEQGMNVQMLEPSQRYCTSTFSLCHALPVSPRGKNCPLAEASHHGSWRITRLVRGAGLRQLLKWHPDSTFSHPSWDCLLARNPVHLWPSANSIHEWIISTMILYLQVTDPGRYGRRGGHIDRFLFHRIWHDTT